MQADDSCSPQSNGLIQPSLPALEGKTPAPYPLGEAKTGRVVDVSSDGARVAFAKAECWVPRAQVSLEVGGDPRTYVHLGDEVAVHLYGWNGKEFWGSIGRAASDWKFVGTALAAGMEVRGVVVAIQSRKGSEHGYMRIDLGPVVGIVYDWECDLDLGFVDIAQKYMVDDEVFVYITKIDLTSSKIGLPLIRLSIARTFDKWRDAFEKLEMRRPIQGIVVDTNATGMFVDLGPIEAYIDGPESSLKPGGQPNQLFNVGDKVDLMLMKIADPDWEMPGRFHANALAEGSIRFADPDHWAYMLKLKTDSEKGNQIESVVIRREDDLIVDLGPINAKIPLDEISLMPGIDTDVVRYFNPKPGRRITVVPLNMPRWLAATTDTLALASIRRAMPGWQAACDALPIDGITFGYVVGYPWQPTSQKVDIGVVSLPLPPPKELHKLMRGVSGNTGLPYQDFDMPVTVLKKDASGKPIQVAPVQVVDSMQSMANTIQVGDILYGTVFGVEPTGLRIHLGDGIKGWVPLIELPENSLKELILRYGPSPDNTLVDGGMHRIPLRPDIGNKVRMMVIDTHYWEDSVVDSSDQRDEQQVVGRMRIELSVRKAELKEMISTGETDKLELKTVLEGAGKKTRRRFLKYRVLKAIVSFVNTGGGHVIIGVSDNGDLKGLQGTDDFLIGDHGEKNTLVSRQSQMSDALTDGLRGWVKSEGSTSILDHVWWRFEDIQGCTVMVIFCKAVYGEGFQIKEPVEDKGGQLKFREHRTFIRLNGKSVPLGDDKLAAWKESRLAKAERQRDVGTVDA